MEKTETQFSIDTPLNNSTTKNISPPIDYKSTLHSMNWTAAEAERPIPRFNKAWITLERFRQEAFIPKIRFSMKHNL